MHVCRDFASWEGRMPPATAAQSAVRGVSEAVGMSARGRNVRSESWLSERRVMTLLNHSCLGGWAVVAFLLGMVVCATGQDFPSSQETADGAAGATVDLAKFGSLLGSDNVIGVEWENPREVEEVVLRLPRGEAIPARSLSVEWWGSVWPNNGSGGWMKLDDPWNGQWVRVFGATFQRGASSATLTFAFPPLMRQEWKEALDPGKYPDKKAPVFRRTLKVRVVSDRTPFPSGCSVVVYGKSRWAEASFDIEARSKRDGENAGRVEIVNGALLNIVSLPSPRDAVVRGRSWTARGNSTDSAGVRVRLRYVKNDDLNSNDLTRVTVRWGKEPDAVGFSFVPQDVMKDGAIRLPDFDALVSETSRALTLANDPGISGLHWEKPVRLRLTERPEASCQSAMEGIPRLSPPRWVPLGVPSARQEVFVSPVGDWATWNASLHTVARDSARIPFRRDKLEAILDTRSEPRFDGKDRKEPVRWLEEEKLPLIHATWHTGAIHFHHALAATILLGDYGDDKKRRGDETVVMVSKLEVANQSDRPETATVHVRYSHPAPLSLGKNGLVTILPADGSTTPGLTAIRGQISNDQPTGGGTAGWKAVKGNEKALLPVLRWQSVLKPGEKRTIYFKAPFVDLLDSHEMNRLKEVSYEREVPKVLDYWRKRLDRGMKIEVPDPALNQFYAANLWHNIITTDRDPVTGLYNQGVGTVRYRVFANETVMIARSMDMRGEHREAERYIEPMIYYQGNEPLTGRFSTKEGVFHSAGAYTHGQYAMNHGFTLWGIADHYLLTRDRAYLERVAPKIVKGCDFLITERHATMTPEGTPRLANHGLAPASSLEDVIEFQYWFATNGYFYLGMKHATEALADIGHPEAARIAREAESYRRDIERVVREAATRAAVVRRRDGQYIPYVPSRVFQWRHLTEGWIREALYSSLHLATAEVVRPNDPLVTWMLDELEDNVFFSWQSGYNVSDLERKWFERGAVTLQPCLLDTPTIYMARDEIPAALRSFWNTYALLIYPDAQCFAEWAPAFGKGGGPLYKTSDESRFVMWLRQLMIWENGEELWFGRGVPRAWLADGKTVRIEGAPTFFGTAGLVIHSESASGRIRATVTLPMRNPAKTVWLRLRHPEGKRPTRVLVNGEPLAADRIRGEDICLPSVREESLQRFQASAEYP